MLKIFPRLKKSNHFQAILLLVVMCCISGMASGQVTRKMAKISLQNLEGEKLDLSSVSGNDVTVFYFLAPDCPLCINYSRNIRMFAEEYAGKKVGFYGVFTGKFYSKEEIETYIKDFKVPIEVLLDPDYELAKAMKARITPEVFVYDKDGKLRYQGKMDNWVVKLGKKRTVITEFYLKDALEALLAGQDVPVKQTDAIGCLIEYR